MVALKKKGGEGGEGKEPYRACGMFLPKDKIRFTVQTFLKLSSDEDSIATLRKSVSELQCSYCLDLLSFFLIMG